MLPQSLLSLAIKFVDRETSSGRCTIYTGEYIVVGLFCALSLHRKRIKTGILWDLGIQISLDTFGRIYLWNCTSKVVSDRWQVG